MPFLEIWAFVFNDISEFLHEDMVTQSDFQLTIMHHVKLPI